MSVSPVLTGNTGRNGLCLEFTDANIDRTHMSAATLKELLHLDFR